MAVGAPAVAPFDHQHPYPPDLRMQRVATADRDAISSFIRWEGMQVYCSATQLTYQLVGGIANTNWVQAGGSGATSLTGDVTGTITSSAINTTIQPGAVTYTKIQNVGANKLLGNATGVAGTLQEITLGTNLSFSAGVLNATGGGGGITALTGDITASGTGSVVTTLATVNSNIGTWNTLTVNGKGLVTAGSNTTYLTTTPSFDATLAVSLSTTRTPSVGGLLITTTGSNTTATWTNSTTTYTSTLSGLTQQNNIVNASGGFAWSIASSNIVNLNAAGALSAVGSMTSPAFYVSNAALTTNYLSIAQSASNIYLQILTASKFFVFQNSTSTNTFTLDSNGNAVFLGNVNSAYNQLVPTTTVPTPSNGLIYYNLTSNLFQLYQNGGWVGIGGGSGITTLTGDITATGSGSVATTLATVNSNVGTFNGITVNAKGLVTAAAAGGYLTANQSITLSGGATGTGTTAITVTLTNASVTGQALTGLSTATGGVITAATTVLGAFGQLQNQITNYAPAASSITYAKIQNVAASKLLGNSTGSAAAPSEITLGTGLVFNGTAIAVTTGLGTLTWAATMTPSFSTNNVLALSMTGSATMNLPTGCVAGQTYIIEVANGGAYTLTWNAAYICPGGTKPVLTSGSGKVDVFTILYDGINYKLIASQNFA